MPTHDFTLEDIKELVHSELRAGLEIELDHTQGMIEQALIKERVHTKKMVQVAVDAGTESVKTHMADQFSSFRDNNLGPVLEEMHEDITVIKDTVKDHGFRISRLEGRLKRS